MKISIQDNVGFKEFLDNWYIENNDPIKSFVNLKPEKVFTARKLIESKWRDIKPKKPKPFELIETLNVIRNTWRTEGRIGHIRLLHLRRIPWVLFYNTKPWLGEDYSFTKAFLSWLWNKKNSYCIVSLLREFLCEYPQELSTFDLFRNALIRLLNDTTTIRLSRWRDRCKKYYFLLDKEEAPVYFAQEWLKSNLGDFEMLSDDHAGLSGKLTQSNFLYLVHNTLFSQAKMGLLKGSIKENELKRTLLLAVNNDNKLRFSDQTKHIVESLLIPFVQDKNPVAGHQKLIEDFILEHLGDPRYGYKTSSKWYGIDDRAREVIIRWRIKVTLDDFFRLLDVTAWDKHWRYRHKFWEAYLKREYITGAWVILGKDAIREAKDILENNNYAEGKRIGKKHAVLLLKVGGITIAEWSHSGACRIWLQNNNSSPKFYRPQYDGTDLRSGSDEAIHHRSSKSGGWQIKLSGKIRELTGINIPYHEYMVSEDNSKNTRWRM